MGRLQKYLKRGTALALAAMMTAGFEVPQNLLAASKQDEIYLGSDSTAFKSKKARSAFLKEAKSLPSKFDLRDVNGKNYVTSVKEQNPWYTCWGFAACAASEESILYEYDITNEEFEADEGKELDLSEKALGWFAYHGLTEADVSPDSVPASQVGEGADVRELEKTDKNAAYDAGGEVLFVTSLFTSGSGPKSENMEVDGEKSYAYCGKNKYTLYEEYTDPDLREAALARIRKEYKHDNPEITDEAAIEAAVLEKYETKAEKVKAKAAKGGTFNYSAVDDWTIPVDYKHRTHENYCLLQESHILPCPAKRDAQKNYLGFDQAGVDAIKSEINEGRAVSIAYRADTTDPGDEITDEVYLNVDGDNPTWAQYTFDDKEEPTHCVTIVGYDDNYSREKFLSGKTKAGVDKQPPKDGAFICKNSWGSQNDKSEGKHYTSEWGIDGSGYFYLSYYDKSLADPESFNFYSLKDEDKPAANGMYINQYDFMPADRIASDVDKDERSMANVFKAEFDQKLTHVSVQSATPGTESTYEIYKLKDGFKNPRDGELLDKGTANFDFGGFHRIPVSENVAIAKGTTFSVVFTNKVLDEENNTAYEVTGFSNRRHQKGASGDEYTLTGVINQGESFICTAGKWKDYTDYIEEVLDPEARSNGVTDAEYDNFAIKAYSIPATKEEVSADLAKAKITLNKAEATYNGKVQSPSVKSVTLNGSKVPAYGYTVSILDANGSKEASPKDSGSYIVEITGIVANNYKGSAQTVYKINQAANTIKVAGKSAAKALTFNVKKAAVKKKAKTYKIARDGNGKISIAKKSSAKLNKYIALSGSNVVLKKKAPKGRYKFTVTVAANNNWKKTTSKVITINVK